MQEYVTIMLRNGKRKDLASNELHVFLGDDTAVFISWLVLIAHTSIVLVFFVCQLPVPEPVLDIFYMQILFVL